MASKITIWNNQRTVAGEESSPVSVGGYDFITVYASGVSGVGQVEVRMSPDKLIYHRSSASGLNIADQFGHAINIPEKGTGLKLKCDTSGNYYSWLYVGNYTYNFTG